jgi:hypothetical protein
MLIAQVAGEYGGMAGLGEALAGLLTRAEDAIAGLGTREYVVIGVAVVLLVFLTRRR